MRAPAVICAFLAMPVGYAAAQDDAVKAVDYVVVDIIDVPGSFRTTVFHLNARGQVAGRYAAGSECEAEEVSFIWTNGEFEYFSYPEVASTSAGSINEPGFVTGSYSADRCSSIVRHGYVRTPEGNFRPVSFTFSKHEVVNGITPSGWMVGTFIDSGCSGPPYPDGCIHGFLFNGRQFLALDPPGSLATDALDINRRREVAGQFTDESGSHGFLLSAGVYEPIDFPGATWSGAFGINGMGDVVGSAAAAGQSVQFIYRRGQFTRVNLVADQAIRSFTLWDINDAGILSGWLVRDSDGKTVGFIAKPARAPR